MNEKSTETRSVIVEREIPYPPERIWRALTQPHLIAEWLMKNDFAPVVGRRFDLRAGWGSVDCQVMAVEANKSLSYTWAAHGLESVVTWTSHPFSRGTHLRMEQVGLPAGSAAGLPGRQDRVGAVLREPGAGIGADGVKSAGHRSKPRRRPKLSESITTPPKPSLRALRSNPAFGAAALDCFATLAMTFLFLRVAYAHFAQLLRRID